MIHPFAHVDVDCSVGEGACVWQFASVIRGAVVGNGCSVASGALVDAATIGRACRIGANAQLHPGLFAGDEVFFGPGCIICNDPWPRVRKGDFDIDALLTKVLVTVKIENNASIGAGAIILPGVEIGANAMVAAGAVVDCCVPAGYLYKRDGEIVEIGRRPMSRMRVAGSAGMPRTSMAP